MTFSEDANPIRTRSQAQGCKGTLGKLLILTLRVDCTTYRPRALPPLQGHRIFSRQKQCQRPVLAPEALKSEASPLVVVDLSLPHPPSRHARLDPEACLADCGIAPTEATRALHRRCFAYRSGALEQHPGQQTCGSLGGLLRFLPHTRELPSLFEKRPRFFGAAHAQPRVGPGLRLIIRPLGGHVPKGLHVECPFVEDDLYLSGNG